MGARHRVHGRCGSAAERDASDQNEFGLDQPELDQAAPAAIFC
jgi:hypothetical protein